MKQLQFTASVQLEIGDEQIDTGPQEFRAIFEEHPNGSATVTHCEINDARHGKPEFWRRVGMPPAALRAIEHWIENDIREEQRRMVENFDAVRRYG
jgi:hypothetical protein